VRLFQLKKITLWKYHSDSAFTIIPVQARVHAGTCRKIFAREGKIIGAILIGNVKEAAELQRMIKAGERYRRM
jgi:hypothetical protein